MRQFQRIFFIVLIACVGLGIFGPGTVHATGGFDVPDINDQFNQFEQSPPPKQDLPAPPPVGEEKGFLDQVTQLFKGAWEWTTDKVSGAWEWTKEKASALWDWFIGVLSKITEIVVDALAAAWDWIKANYKKIIVLLLIIVLAVFAVWLITTAAALIAAGSTLTILSSTISPQILSFVGYGILLGGGFGGFISLLSGNEFMSMEMLTDTLFGGIAGGIGGLFGELIGGARFITWLGSKIRWLPNAVKGAAGAGVEQSVFDFFKTGKINVKNTLIAIGVGGLLSYGGWLFTNNLDTIVTSINKISFPTVKVYVLASADSNLRIPSLEIGHTKIEDTQFGSWLQKFASNHTTNSTDTFLQKVEKRINELSAKLKRGKDVKIIELVDCDIAPKCLKTSDGRIIKIQNYKYANRTETSISKWGKEYTVKFDQYAQPDFNPYIIKGKNGELAEIELPQDTWVAENQTAYQAQLKLSTYLFIKKYPDWKTRFDFTPEQIKSIENGNSNIGNKRTKTGLTWHHDTKSGKMILVPWDLHDLFRHTGGNAIWAKQIIE
ncbi:HNH endonuclease [Thermoactinomyces mirandus]|uniref:HNH endonuclease n=1 Tax=Thermoactinomyces mirandus TaxID=2756294 RepID=A0A7W1XSL4_9BACL|nr:HNH endonuclease [Thermoactinomyces mirandus]MBA4602469.1 HNH endonuclease [Thermoactinomyces mirandus]